MKKFMLLHFGFEKPTHAAEKLVQGNPFIASIRVYEMRPM
jgi:hypothetical protein